MQTIITDTGVLHYMVLIRATHLFPLLFDTILIPQKVYDELTHPRAPFLVREFMTDVPSWLEVQSISDANMHFDGFEGIHAGECEAIVLAKEKNISLVLMDDRRARKVAEQQGLTVFGTLGMIERGARRGAIDLDSSIDALQKTNFWISAKQIEYLRQRHRTFLKK